MKKSNLTIWLVIFTLGMLVACGHKNTDVGNAASGDSGYKKVEYSDAEWVEKITGTWTYANVSDTEIRYYEETYFADMTTCGFFHDAGFNYDTRVGLFKGAWKVVDGVLIASDTIATSNTYLDESDVIEDRIISVDRDVMILQALVDGVTYKRYRLKQPRHRANCKLWENFDLDEDEIDEDAKVKI